MRQRVLQADSTQPGVWARQNKDKGAGPGMTHLHLAERQEAIVVCDRGSRAQAHRDVAAHKGCVAVEIVDLQVGLVVRGAQRVGHGVLGRVSVAHAHIKVLEAIGDVVPSVGREVQGSAAPRGAMSGVHATRLAAAPSPVEQSHRAHKVLASQVCLPEGRRISASRAGNTTAAHPCTPTPTWQQASPPRASSVAQCG